MVPSLTGNCNCTISNLTVGSLRSASATVDWIFCWNNSAQSANRVKVEGQGASEQFKEGGQTHEPKSTTTTSFRTTILQQVVPDHNFEKMHIIVVATLLQLVVHDKLLTNHADCHLGYFLQRKILWVGFFPSFDLLIVSSEIIVIIVQDVLHLRYSS